MDIEAFIIPNLDTLLGPNPNPSLDAIISLPDGLYSTNHEAGVFASFLSPQEIYNGEYTDAKEMRIRIANGGAGQSGLIGAWADEFIKYKVQQGNKPFLIGWYLADTTESLGLLAAGSVDIAVSYNATAERQSMATRACQRRVYGFRDHFMLVGPESNPAQLKWGDDIFTMLNNIVTQGNIDASNPPKNRPATRFLSRSDKSAANIKENELFMAIGQVPWALAHSKWYHQYPFPRQAL